MAFPAVAATSTATYNGVGSNIKTVTKETHGTYSDLTAMIGETELHATNTSYYTAPKFVSYYTYKYNGTNFVRIEGGISTRRTRCASECRLLQDCKGRQILCDGGADSCEQPAAF